MKRIGEQPIKVELTHAQARAITSVLRGSRYTTPNERDAARNALQRVERARAKAERR